MSGADFWGALIIREDGVRVRVPTNLMNSMLAIGLCALVAGCSGGSAGVATSAMPPQLQSPGLTTQSTKAAQGNVTFAIEIREPR